MNAYITSLNTKSGKTVISAGIAAVMQSLGYNAGLYKPIQQGAIDKGNYLISPDLTFVKLLDPYITTHSSYMFTKNSLPATIEDINPDIQIIERDYQLLCKKAETILVEAPCSLMTPINDTFFTYQIPQILKLPVIFVITPNDTIGHYLAEINSAKALGLDVIGVIINKFTNSAESEEIKNFPYLIASYSDVKVIGIIKNFKGKSIKANILINEILNGIELEQVFNMKIPKLSIY